jgi:hypothetical protein
MLRKITITLMLASVLQGCGGGGGGGSSTPGGTTYTIGGTVSGLTGAGLVLQNNGGDNLAISANGAFTFAASLPNGSAYAVSVLAQPTGPTQVCTVTNGDGNVAGNNITTPSVNCVDSVVGGGGGGDQFGSGPDPIPDPSGNPSSSALIATALSAGTITQEQAIVYEMYANFNDARLPANFRGDDTSVIEGRAHANAMEYIAAVGKANVSPATIALLQPFFLPPHIEGSWWQLKAIGQVSTYSVQTASLSTGTNISDVRFDGVKLLSQLTPRAHPSLVERFGWRAVEGPHVVIWYHKDNESPDLAVATRLVHEYETTIWPVLTQLMGGRIPKSDLNILNGELNLLYRDDDGRLDVYLADISIEGTTHCVDGGTKNCPVRTLLNRNLSVRGLISVAAHEFMHALQFSYDVTASSLGAYHTILEATAVWAQHYVYPSNHWETAYPRHYLTGGFVSKSYDDKNTPELFAYGAYVFPLFLETKFGPSIMKHIWDATLAPGGMTEEMLAIEAAVKRSGSTFEETWRAFVEANWNQETLKTYVPFGVTDLTTLESDTALALTNGFGAAKHDVNLPHASMAYYRVILSGSQRSLNFVNGLTFKHRAFDQGIGTLLYFAGLDTAQRHGASMQVYLKVNGAWQSGAVNFSTTPWFTVCRDDPAGKIEEIIFMYGNGEITQSQPNYTALTPLLQQPGIVATDIGCRNWTGSLNMLRPTTGGQETLVIANFKMTNVLPTAAPTPGPTPPPYAPAAGVEISADSGYVYKIASGDASWSYSEVTSNCSVSGSGTFSVVGAGTPSVIFSNWAPPGLLSRSLSFGGFTLDVRPTVLNLSAARRCVDAQGHVVNDTVVVGNSSDISVIPFDQSMRINSGGLSIGGNGTPTGGTGTWSLTGATN